MEQPQTLFKFISGYVYRFGLARKDAALGRAVETVREVAVVAIEHAGRFTLGWPRLS